ncbi:hypothetical protein GLOTRDRAFT_62772 [Gloeophyllum trabeum ATCC 11539]|uniref:RNI-like protein n=1 Tax=Gloeophyllum trabeum (strain ATCC 11539 / FP-39264 / Madison 617) TaxID=670483 RepID=S7RIS5_GLOTA|nr:uncharacterized protein GLOTRDRAFT_62772 [Gloeophyllum trabeum ATCC 11539]EPQ54250.1 hypothetical protein GLOTRDRAFT_62772 [Gloeophyllum trabeum ATCC 11539]
MSTDHSIPRVPSGVENFPPELLFTICAHVYYAGLPPVQPSLDPLILAEHGIPTSTPSSLPPANWPEPVARKTLHSLSLANRAWHDAAKPWLWRKVEVRLPRSWLSLIDAVVGGDDEEAAEQQAALVLGQTIKEAENAVLAARNIFGDDADPTCAEKLHESILATLGGPGGPIPPELLSPPASRDPSPRRLRAKSKSPVRWKLMRSISDAVQTVLGRDEVAVYVPIPEDPRPGRHIRHLDFNHFRTIGMRRSVEEGVNSRFVTGDRLEAIIKEMPNLTVFGATEYMDGALTLPVLKELFLRGSSSRGRRFRGRTPETSDADEEEKERLRECKEIVAADFTGCVSAVFVHALTDFVNTYLTPPSDPTSDDEGTDRFGGRRSRFAAGNTHVLEGLERLGFYGAKSLAHSVLHQFVLSCPSLTHLDLSCTRITPELFTSLAASSIRLQSLSIGRCTRLTGESIRDFLVEAEAASDIQELSLYGDSTFPCPLSVDELRDVLTRARCFTSGKLRYLDLSSSPLTREVLLTACPPQPQLRSLGLSHIANLPLDIIAEFLKTKAPHVEVLTLASTSPDLGYGQTRVPLRAASLALHAKIIRPLCTALVSFSLSAGSSAPAQAPTRLRVIELSPALLGGLGAGAGSWRVIRSKGGRGWYVDVASGWVTTPSAGAAPRQNEGGEQLCRGLAPDHPLRVEMERLAYANGNVNSGVGWHARKMEILHGQGLLGREDGLYGAVSFAYQG